MTLALGKMLPRRSAPVAGFLVVAGVAWLLTSWMLDRPPGLAPPPLPPEGIHGELAAGEGVSFGIELAAGDFLAVEVEQDGADLAVTLLDPRRRPLFRVDSPNGRWGVEALAAVTARSGRYLLALRAGAGAGGKYRVRPEGPRPATPEDRLRAGAARLFAAAEPLRRVGTREAWTRALPLYRQALAGAEAGGDARLRAAALDRIGRALARLDQPAEALAAWRQARAEYHLLEDGREEGLLAHRIALLYQREGRLGEAEATWREAILTFRRAGDGAGEALVANDLALLLKGQGRPREALPLYEAALELWRRVGEKEEEATTRHNLGELYYAVGRFAAAAELFQHLAESQGRGTDPAVRAATLTSLGAACRRLGDLATSREVLGEALELRREAGDVRGEAVTRTSLGSTALAGGDPIAAEADYTAALAGFQAAGDADGEAIALSNLGQVALARHQPGEALERIDRALVKLADLGDPGSRAVALRDRAEALAGLGRLPEALASIRQAMDLEETLRQGPAGPTLRTSYFATRQSTYEVAVEILIRLEEAEPGRGWAAEALTTAERARARGLADQLLAARRRARFRVDPALLAEERTLRRHLDTLEARRRTGEGGGEAQEGEIRTTLPALWSVEERIEAAMTAGAGELGGAESLPLLTLPEIRRQLLDGRTRLLFYALGEARSFLWVIGPESLSYHVLPPRAEIETAARRLAELLPASAGSGVRAQALLAAERLSRQVLAPAAGEIAGARRLLIAPEGALHLVPFAALPLRIHPGGPGPPGEPDLLIGHHDIITLPSASVAAKVRAEHRRDGGRRSKGGWGPLAVLADPVFAPAPEGPPPLPGTRQEGLAILALAAAGGVGEPLVAFGPAARRDRVLAGELAACRTIHIATHGILDAEHPELSGLLLSQVDGEGRPLPGFLATHDIATLRLSADLVVLSACRTALGREVPGEGLSGLAQAFLIAGAGQVLVSLFRVDDRATAELMERFYRRLLLGGEGPEEALAGAQRSLLSEAPFAAPAHWAGFILYGGDS